MTVDIAADLAVFFSTDALGAQSATYTPAGGGAPLSVTVLKDSPEAPASAGGPGPAVRVARTVAHVRKSEIAAPQRDAELQIGGDSFRVQSFTLSADGLIWQLGLAPL